MIVDLLFLQAFSLASISFIMAELAHRSKIRFVVSFQKGVDGITNNLESVSNDVKKKGASFSIVSFGRKVFNMHHSRLGWFLATASVILANINLFWLSVGMIVHHIIREKKIF